MGEITIWFKSDPQSAPSYFIIATGGTEETPRGRIISTDTEKFESMCQRYVILLQLCY